MKKWIMVLTLAGLIVPATFATKAPPKETDKKVETQKKHKKDKVKHNKKDETTKAQ